MRGAAGLLADPSRGTGDREPRAPHRTRPRRHAPLPRVPSARRRLRGCREQAGRLERHAHTPPARPAERGRDRRPGRRTHRPHDRHAAGRRGVPVDGAAPSADGADRAVGTRRACVRPRVGSVEGGMRAGRLHGYDRDRPQAALLSREQPRRDHRGRGSGPQSPGDGTGRRVGRAGEQGRDPGWRPLPGALHVAGGRPDDVPPRQDPRRPTPHPAPQLPRASQRPPRGDGLGQAPERLRATRVRASRRGRLRDSRRTDRGRCRTGHGRRAGAARRALGHGRRDLCIYAAACHRRAARPWDPVRQPVAAETGPLEPAGTPQGHLAERAAGCVRIGQPRTRVVDVGDTGKGHVGPRRDRHDAAGGRRRDSRHRPPTSSWPTFR